MGRLAALDSKKWRGVPALVGGGAGTLTFNGLGGAAPAASAGGVGGSAGCSYAYYRNEPYGSQAWYRGWSVRVRGDPSHWVLHRYNDQASSWDSCSSGQFFVNEPHTDPYPEFPANRADDFPWGKGPQRQSVVGVEQ
jgi:hypothetical protein